jgi:hypothetical protein
MCKGPENSGVVIMEEEKEEGILLPTDIQASK